MLVRRRASTSSRRVLIIILAFAVCACTPDQKHQSASAPTSSPSASTQTAVFEDLLSKTEIALAADAAPTGAKLTATPAISPLPQRATALLKPLTSPLDIALSGQQPVKPATISAALKSPLPSADNIWLITQHASSDAIELQPARYNPATRTLTAAMPHFSLAFFARIDVGTALSEITKAFKGTFGLAKERTRCAGKPLVDGQIRYTLPERYLSKGDGIVWPCLSKDGKKVVLDLTAASGLPYLVRVNPKATLTYGGTVDLGKAVVMAGYMQLVKNPPYTQALLVPGSSISYSFNAGELPGIAVAKLDVGTHLALSVVWAVQFVLAIFGPKVALLENAEVLSCIGDAVEAATPQGKVLSGVGIGAVIKASISCAGPLIRAAGGIVTKLVGAVLSVLAGGVGLVVAGIEGALRTATGQDLANVQIGRRVDTGLTGSPFVGEWWVHGGTMTIRTNGTATISYRYGTCESAPTEDCYIEQTLSVQLTADPATATTTVRSVRYLAYLDGSSRAIANPDPDLTNSSEQPGTVQRFRLTASNIIKNIDRNEDDGNPYFCRTDDPPPNNGPCGA
jgi:hypothetical protein